MTDSDASTIADPAPGRTAPTTAVPSHRWLPALHYPGYRLFWFGMLCLASGLQIGVVAQLWLVHQLTGSPAYLGFVQFASFFPMVVLSLIGGVLADRVDRGLFIIFSRSIIVCMNAILAVLVFTGLIQVWMIIAVALIGALVVSVEVPARMATYPTLVREEDLPNAVTLNIAAWNITSVTGPAIAGPIVNFIGPGGGYALAALLQAGAVVFFALLRSAPRPERSASSWEHEREDSFWSSLVGGFSYIRNHAVLLALLAMALMPNLLGQAYYALLPAFAADVLRGDAALYGSLLSAGGVGAVLATITFALAEDIRRKGVLAIVSGLAVGLLLVLFAQIRAPMLGLLGAAILGLAQGSFMTINSILIQSHVDDAHRGRVMSVWMAIWGFSALGTLGMGALASVIGVPAAFMAAGAAIVVSLVLVTLRFPHLRRVD